MSDLRFHQYGAPIIDGVNFSISHASGLIILVEGNEKIGVDTLDKRKTNEGVVKKYFASNEMYPNNLFNSSIRYLLLDDF